MELKWNFVYLCGEKNVISKYAFELESNRIHKFMLTRLCHYAMNYFFQTISLLTREIRNNSFPRMGIEPTDVSFTVCCLIASRRLRTTNLKCQIHFLLIMNSRISSRREVSTIGYISSRFQL